MNHGSQYKTPNLKTFLFGRPHNSVLDIKKSQYFLSPYSELLCKHAFIYFDCDCSYNPHENSTKQNLWLISFKIEEIKPQKSSNMSNVTE